MHEVLFAPAGDDWMLDLEHIELFLDGRLVLVPAALRNFVESQKWGPEKTEIAYLIWSTIYSATKYDNGGRYRSIHNKLYDYGGTETVKDARNTLITAGYIQTPKRRSYKKKSHSLSFRAPHRGEVVPIVLKEKSFADCKGYKEKYEQDEHVAYTRRCLDLLEVDRDHLFEGVQSIIGDYKSKKEARARKEERQGARKKKEGIKNAEEALMRLGKPLFELIHKTGRITRSRPEKGHRLFSPYAFLMTEFRPLFTFGGQKMAFIDAVESQVNLLGNLSGDSQLIEDTCNRRFYRQVAEEFDLRNERGEIHRNEGKDPFYKYAFARYRPSFYLTPYMAERYPKADQFMREQKVGNYKKASWLLQGFESRIFLDGVYGRLREADIPAISIHDGIATPESYGQKVKEIVEEEFVKNDIVGELVLEV